MNQPQMQMMMPLTKMAKRLIVINVVIWVVGVLIIQQMILGEPLLFNWFGLIPYKLINDFWLWQPFTYMFIHSTSVMHVLFNMLLLWWLGSELEQRWGSRFFLTYFLTCGIGTGFLYSFCMLMYFFISNNHLVLQMPVVGASGAIFGLLLAYGMIFGEKVVYFMMMFPMKAKYFVMLLGAMEILTMMDSGLSGQTANLAHLGGIVVGFIFLTVHARLKRSGGAKRSFAQSRGRKLKLVVDNEKPGQTDAGGGPKYWN